MLDGKWAVAGDDYKHTLHSSLLKAKQHCSNGGKCFGIMVWRGSWGYGSVYSINFPIRLSDNYHKIPNWHIYKKENSFGNILYDECPLSLD